VSPLGKWRFDSDIRSFLEILPKHISRSARSNDNGWVTGTSLPVAVSNHSSMPQKWAEASDNPRASTIRATSGSCSVGPIGPQMPTGLSDVLCRQAVMYSSASAR